VGGKPSRSSLKGLLGFKPNILDFNLFFLLHWNHVLPLPVLWKTEPQHKENQIPNPFFPFLFLMMLRKEALSPRQVETAQLAHCLIVWFRDKIREPESSCGIGLKWVMKVGHFIFRNLE
jgi:hypothetical protein